MSNEDGIECYSGSAGTSSNIANMESSIIYVCNICFRQYTLIEDLRGHFIEYHKCTPKVAEIPSKEGKSVELTNKDCQTAGAEESDKLRNLQIESQKEDCVKLEIRPMPFKNFRIVLRSKMIKGCPVTNSCPYKFENEAKLALHTKCHTCPDAAQKFKCYECSVEMTNWRRCTAHLWKAHQIDVDLLQCPQCEYKAHASVLVWRHMRAHKKWRMRVIRSLRAVQRKRLQQDLKNCDLSVIQAAPIHMRQHTGEKPLHCKVCKFSTRDPSVLHKHQLRHEKAEKLKCAHCDFSCIQTNAYKRHMRLNHSEEYKKIACDLCNYVTISSERLQAHKNDHLKGLIVNHEDSMDATRSGTSKNLHKLRNKNEMSADCFLPIESIDSLPHEPAVDTGGVTIPAPSEDTQFPTYLNN
ncbi:PREDICTED: zinc finger protein 64 homolog, isoforms 1 and 2 isoform X3 [Bactrocera latifrons]|nr:PREDICTED: zinc finger protein 64 homolog, isoforms 1 and 2 isoform X3 [Bactrocera latifrons]